MDPRGHRSEVCHFLSQGGDADPLTETPQRATTQVPQCCPRRGGWLQETHRLSSGMWRAIMIFGSVHSTIHPCRSLIRPTSTRRKSFGMRLQVMGVSIWMMSLGGLCGSGFFRSLRNMAAEIGMMFCRERKRERRASLQETRLRAPHCSGR